MRRTQRSAKLIAPLRRKMAYPFFRRLLAFAFVLTAWQVMLVIWGATLDGGRRGLREAIFTWASLDAGPLLYRVQPQPEKLH